VTPQKARFSQALVTQAYNLSYLEAEIWRINSSQDLISKITRAK
jgi:hypothetical protein